jgi:hypothetical protein
MSARLKLKWQGNESEILFSKAFLPETGKLIFVDAPRTFQPNRK